MTKNLFNLSDRQQKTVGAAITLLSGLFILYVCYAIFKGVGLFLNHFSGVFLPLVTAAIVALVLDPWYEKLCGWCKGKRILALILLFLSIIVPILALSVMFGALIVDQVSQLLLRIPDWLEGSRDYLIAKWPTIKEFMVRVGLEERLNNLAETQGAFLAKTAAEISANMVSAGAGIFAAGTGLLGWAVFPVYFAFFLYAKPMKQGNFSDFFPFLKEQTREDVVYLIEEFITIIVAFFRGQLIIAFLQGLLYAFGFMLVGLPFGFIIGLVLGFLNIIPYLGNMIGLGVALPLAYFHPDGGMSQLVMVLIVFGLVQVIEGYVLTPRIMGEKTGLHPMMIIVSIFFWGSALNGLLGMVLAIPLTAFLVVFWRLARKKQVFTGIV